MPVRYRVIFSARASSDLHEIHSHIEKDSPRNASSVIAELIDAIDSLEQLPLRYPVYSGHVQPSEAVRRMPVPPFLIYYRVHESRGAVELITVRHGARRQP
jgi:toxin ParE1/3/4